MKKTHLGPKQRQTRRLGPFFSSPPIQTSVVAVVVPVLTRSLIVNKSNIYIYI